MKVDGSLEKSEGLRLEALRLAVAAGQPELRDAFYAFLTADDVDGPRQPSDAAPENNRVS